MLWGHGKKKQKPPTFLYTKAKAHSWVKDMGVPISQAENITNSKSKPRSDSLEVGSRAQPTDNADCDLLVEGNSELNFTTGIYLPLKAIQLAVHLSTRNVFSPLFYLSDELKAYVR